MEDLNSDIKMLDVFCEFLINKNKNFQYKPNKNALSLSDFTEKTIKLRESAMTQHLNPAVW